MNERTNEIYFSDREISLALYKIIWMNEWMNYDWLDGWWIDWKKQGMNKRTNEQTNEIFFSDREISLVFFFRLFELLIDWLINN